MEMKLGSKKARMQYKLASSTLVIHS